jgi:nucleotide-binding universal stress UspA family protein
LEAEAKYSPALERATRLASECRASLKLVDVVDEVPGYLRVLIPSACGLFEMLAQYKSERLEHLASALRHKGLAVTSTVLRGCMPGVLIGEVAREGHDLLLKTGAPCGSARRYGAIDRRLLRKCPCVVWLEKPCRPKRRKRRILAAVDPVTDDPEVLKFSRRVLDVALSLAEFEHSELHIVHAWRVWGERILRGEVTRADAATVDCYVEASRRQAEEALKKLVADFAGRAANACIHLIKGEAGAVIPATARKEKIDVVVMGTAARSGAPGFLIGNTAEQIIGEITCSLMAIKPEGLSVPIPEAGAPAEEPPKS